MPNTKNASGVAQGVGSGASKKKKKKKNQLCIYIAANNLKQN
jgi:hypothetical protein